MIEEITTRFPIGGEEIPALLARPEGGNPRGVVLLLHGLGADKSAQRPEIRRLARVGFTAVAVDAPAHGQRLDRSWLDDIEREGRSGPRASFLRLLSQTMAELPAIITILRQQEHPRLALAGISMGGHAAFQAMLLPDKPDVCAPLIASPDVRCPAFSPATPRQHPEVFAPTPLLIVTAGRDQIVPPAETIAFVEELRPRYAAVPARLVHFHYPEADHVMPPRDWKDAWDHITEFLERFLPEGSTRNTAPRALAGKGT